MPWILTTVELSKLSKNATQHAVHFYLHGASYETTPPKTITHSSLTSPGSALYFSAASLTHSVPPPGGSFADHPGDPSGPLSAYGPL